MDTREIVIPHDHKRRPLVAVRRMLVHSSIAELTALGLYESYCTQIAPESLASINELLGPGWMPLQLALDHYRACDKLGLGAEDIASLGRRAGAKLGHVLLVANPHASDENGRPEPWKLMRALSRMQQRVYDGGSSQYVKLGPKKLLIEYRDNPLFAIAYYSRAYGGYMRTALGSLGLDIIDIQLSVHRGHDAQTDALFTWK